MDINRFTEKAQEAVRAAQTLATRYSNQQIEVEHLLLALLDQQGGLVPSILTRAGVNVDPLKGAVEREINRFLQASADTIYPLEYSHYLLGDVAGKTILDFGCGAGRRYSWRTATVR